MQWSCYRSRGGDLQSPSSPHHTRPSESGHLPHSPFPHHYHLSRYSISSSATVFLFISRHRPPRPTNHGFPCSGQPAGAPTPSFATTACLQKCTDSSEIEHCLCCDRSLAINDCCCANCLSTHRPSRDILGIRPSPPVTTRRTPSAGGERTLHEKPRGFCC